jgi:hypothetical protein
MRHEIRHVNRPFVNKKDPQVLRTLLKVRHDTGHTNIQKTFITCDDFCMHRYIYH